MTDPVIVLLAFVGLFLFAIALHFGFLAGSEAIARHPIRVLLGLFICVLVSGEFAMAAFGVFSSGAFWPLMHIATAYGACALVYIITYLGLEEDSPSVTMVRFVEMAGSKGRRREEFQRIIRDEDLLLPRLRAMSESGFIVSRGGRWRITRKGRRFEWNFSFWARFLGVCEGG